MMLHLVLAWKLGLLPLRVVHGNWWIGGQTNIKTTTELFRARLFMVLSSEKARQTKSTQCGKIQPHRLNLLAWVTSESAKSFVQKQILTPKGNCREYHIRFHAILQQHREEKNHKILCFKAAKVWAFLKLASFKLAKALKSLSEIVRLWDSRHFQEGVIRDWTADKSIHFVQHIDNEGVFKEEKNNCLMKMCFTVEGHWKGWKTFTWNWECSGLCGSLKTYCRSYAFFYKDQLRALKHPLEAFPYYPSLQLQAQATYHRFRDYLRHFLNLFTENVNFFSIMISVI